LQSVPAGAGYFKQRFGSVHEAMRRRALWLRLLQRKSAYVAAAKGGFTWCCEAFVAAAAKSMFSAFYTFTAAVRWVREACQ
jgi:hypothetical protein